MFLKHEKSKDDDIKIFTFLFMSVGSFYE